jgi:hypothetical protein
MKLRYLKGNTIRVNWKGTGEFTDFSPVGETTDERGQRLLDNPYQVGKFEKVEEATVVPVKSEIVPTFKCEHCERLLKTKAALGSHMRKHKEMVT